MLKNIYSINAGIYQEIKYVANQVFYACGNMTETHEYWNHLFHRCSGFASPESLERNIMRGVWGQALGKISLTSLLRLLDNMSNAFWLFDLFQIFGKGINSSSISRSREYFLQQQKSKLKVHYIKTYKEWKNTFYERILFSQNSMAKFKSQEGNQLLQ